MQSPTNNPKRRGSPLAPPNRFEKLHILRDLDAYIEPEDGKPKPIPTEIYSDQSKSVVTKNESPDIPFRYSLNPYRGCEHGCTYCYARPSHETLGWTAGLDFERRILAKLDAPKLLRDFLRRPAYRCEPIVLSGVTDPYQPIERNLKITRQCLEVFRQCRHPVEIVSKGRLLLRDIDILADLANQNLVAVSIAITTLDQRLQHAMEPRASSPSQRIDTMRQLSQAGVPVRLLLAPLIPGWTDSEMPAILKAAKGAGATSASYVVLRLPYAVKDVFFDWLDRTYPAKRPIIESRIRQIRAGKLNDDQFGSRMKGSGLWAEEIRQLFQLFAARYGLDRHPPPLNTALFDPPPDPSGQLTLF